MYEQSSGSRSAKTIATEFRRNRAAVPKSLGRWFAKSKIVRRTAIPRDRGRNSIYITPVKSRETELRRCTVFLLYRRYITCALWRCSVYSYIYYNITRSLITVQYYNKRGRAASRPSRRVSTISNRTIYIGIRVFKINMIIRRRVLRL